MANYVGHTAAKRMNMVNPYPGLRPFSTLDANMFFGRDDEVELMLNNLRKNRILVITGEPGIGKTSLVNAGLVPSLKNQGDWIIFKLRPGSSPLQDLYKEIAKKHRKEMPVDPADPGSVINILSEMHKEYQAGVLIFVDQFEEIFLRDALLSEETQNKNRDLFVDFLLQVSGQQEIPIHLIITIRSDFLDECSVFREFSDFIDIYNFSLGKLSPDNATRAIMGPLEVSNINIQRDLVKKIISDVQDNPDFLPVMQHALMKTWQYWNARKVPESPIGIEDYEQIGTVDHAISKCADEAYGQLSDEERVFCERIFRILSERDSKNRDICIPLTVSKVSEKTQIPVEKVIRIADIFRREGRGFIVPGINVSIDKNSEISISHESLMKLWYRLDEWADNEYESVQMYLSLAEASGLYQVGKAELWRPPELEAALEWYRINKPNLAWAERYNPAFERTMVFLNTSEREFAMEEEERFQEERRKRILNRILAGVLGVTAVIAIIIFSIQHTKKVMPGEEQLSQSTTQNPTGEVNPLESAESPAAAGQDAQEGMNESAENTVPQDTESQAQPVTDQDKGNSVTPVRRQETSPPATVNDNTTARTERTLNNRDNQSRTEPARNPSASEKPRESPVSGESTPEVVLSPQKVIPVINSMAAQSLNSSGDPDLRALLAYQAFLFNKEYNDDRFNADIYTGLYQSIKTFRGKDYNVYEGHTNAVRTVDFMPNSTVFYSGGSDGSIIRWDLSNSQKKHTTILSGQNVIDMLKVTPNGKWLIFAESNAGLNIINLSGRSITPDPMTGNEKNIRTIAVAPDNNTLYTAGLDNYIEMWNITVRSARKLTDTESRVNALSVSPNGSLLAGGLRNGKLMVWKLRAGVDGQMVRDNNSDAIQSIQFSKNGRYMACGTLYGNILIYRADNFTLVKTLKGHKARVTSLAFNPDGSRLVSGSYDGQVILWDLADTDSKPAMMNDNSGFIFAVAFSPDGDYFVSGSAKEPRLVARPGNASIPASQICNLVKRDMTKDEWNTYVGNDIPYRKTCNGNGTN